MASLGAGYDLSATTFSPDGRIFQVEYATKAVDISGTVLGLRLKDGVVLAIEKPIHSRLAKRQAESCGNRRISTVALSSGVVGAGLAADCRALANRAREECSSHRASFEVDMPGKMLADRMSLFMQAYTLYSSVRPFCATMIIATVDEDGPHLHMVEPSGVSWGYRACTAGKGRQTVRTEMEKLALEDMSVEAGVYEAARLIYLAHDEAKDKDFELELSWIGPQTANMHQLVPEDLVQKAIAKAKEAVAALMDY